MVKNRYEVAVVIPDDHKRILVYRDFNLPNSLWDLPKSEIQGGDFKENAQRIVSERLGLEAKIKHDLGALSHPFGDIILYTQVYGIKGKVNDIAFSNGFKWVDVNELVDIAQNSSLAARIYLKSIGKKW
ncbi:NUDIX domain-containing protein [Candidatus Pacearchaeota archaeon]|nr:NUDIX domain-containing protein [Candidatus Pacearchaeota archaeon]